MKARAFFGATLFYSFANGLFSGLPLIVLPWLAAALGSTGYGRWVAYSSVSTAILSIGGLSANAFVLLEWPRATNSAQRADLVKAALLVGVGGIAVTLAIGPIWRALNPTATLLNLPWLFAAGLQAMAMSCIVTLLAVWQSEFRPGQFAAFRIVHAVVLVTVTIGIALTVPNNWERVAEGQLIVAVCAVAAGAAMQRRLFGGAEVMDWSKFGQGFKFGLLLLPHTLGSVAISVVDKILVGTLVGPAELGVYGIAAQIGLALALINDSANRTYAPWLNRALVSGLQADNARASRVVAITYAAFLGLLGLAATVGLLLEDLLPHVLAPGFSRSSDYVLVLCVGQGFNGMYFLVVNYVIYARRFLSLAAVSLTAGVLNISLGLALVPRFGALGAAYSVAAGQFALFVGTWWLAARFVPMPWTHLGKSATSV